MPAKGVLRIKILGDAKGVDSAVGVAVDKVKAGALAMGAAFIAGVGQAMDIEAATDKMSASLGLTAKESERLGGVAGNLYSQAYGESMEDVTGAIESVIGSISGMRDASADAVQDMTAKVMNMASAFEMESGRIAQVAGQMITAGLARDGTHAVDLLTAALQRVPKAVREDLIDAVDEYGPFMKSLGITGEKAMNMLVTASSKGMYGIDKMGDSLKEFTIRATDMSTASKAGFDALGMSQADMAGKLLAGGETARQAFDKIVRGLLSIKDPVKQSQAALALFGTPLEDLNVSEIPKFLQGLLATKNNLGQVAGAADRMGKTLNDNAKSNLTSFWRTLQMAFVNVLGGYVIPIITKFAGFLASTVGPIISTIASFLGATLVPALQAVGSWVSQNSALFGFFGSIIAGMMVPFLAYKGVVLLIAAAMRIWTTVVLAAKTAFFLLNLVMRANPIGLVITLVAGLVGGIIYLWNKSAAFRNFFIGAWKAVEPFVSAVGDAIGWVIEKIADAVGWLVDMSNAILNIIGLGNEAKGSFSGGDFGGKRAGGGAVDMGKVYLTGERGRELFIPNQSGYIVSNADTEALMGQAQRGANTTLAGLATGASAAPAGGSTYVQNTYNFPNYLGSKNDLVRTLRGSVRQSGRGSAERYLGTGS